MAGKQFHFLFPQHSNILLKNETSLIGSFLNSGLKLHLIPRVGDSEAGEYLLQILGHSVMRNLEG